MVNLTSEELEKAYKFWLVKRSTLDVERAIYPFLSDNMIPFIVGNSGWLKTARTELSLSAATVATKISLSRSAYSKFEESEMQGTITLATLAKAAAAMECELVYAIRPKSRKQFSRIIWDVLLPLAVQHSWVRNCDPKRKAEAVAFIAKRIFNQSKFRKQQGWSEHPKRLGFEKNPSEESIYSNLSGKIV